MGRMFGFCKKGTWRIICIGAGITVSDEKMIFTCWSGDMAQTCQLTGVAGSVVQFVLPPCSQFGSMG